MPKNRSRKGTQPSSRRAPVHFVFRAHSPTDSYKNHGLLEGTRTMLVEAGTPADAEVTLHELHRQLEIPGRSAKDIADIQFAITAMRKGIAVKPGERLLNEGERNRLIRNRETHQTAYVKALTSWSLSDARDFFEKYAKSQQFRNGLILRTVKESKKPLIAEYGTMHSVLSRAFQKEGIEHSRHMPPQVFPWSSIVVQKMNYGKPVSDLEIKKAFLTAAGMEAVGIAPANDAEWRLQSALTTTCMNRLSQTQINRLFQDRNPLGALTENGLPPRPSREEKEAFLQKHSEFWRREQRLKALKKK